MDDASEVYVPLQNLSDEQEWDLDDLSERRADCRAEFDRVRAAFVACSVTPQECPANKFKLAMQSVAAPSSVSEEVTVSPAVERERTERLEGKVAALQIELDGARSNAAKQKRASDSLRQQPTAMHRKTPGAERTVRDQSEETEVHKEIHEEELSKLYSKVTVADAERLGAKNGVAGVALVKEQMKSPKSICV